MATPHAQTQGFDHHDEMRGLEASDVAIRDLCASVREDDPTPYPGEPIAIVIPTDEFSLVCPWRGRPDLGKRGRGPADLVKLLDPLRLTVPSEDGMITTVGDVRAVTEDAACPGN